MLEICALTLVILAVLLSNKKYWNQCIHNVRTGKNLSRTCVYTLLSWVHDFFIYWLMGHRFERILASIDWSNIVSVAFYRRELRRCFGSLKGRPSVDCWYEMGRRRHRGRTGNAEKKMTGSLNKRAEPPPICKCTASRGTAARTSDWQEQTQYGGEQGS